MSAPHPLLEPLRAGDRRALARAITLVESTIAADRAAALELLQASSPSARRALRVGISGPPGAGKSTLIEALGLAAIEEGHRVAVLAVDPTSRVTGGSILGDKTRMERLATHGCAFVRPSPSRDALGGVAAHTVDAIRLCEAAGYDVVFVETVGAGQSDSAVVPITDVFVLLQLAHAGDDLQAIKRGALELADVLVVNKSDLDESATRRAALQLQSARRSPVYVISARSGAGVRELWADIGARPRKSAPADAAHAGARHPDAAHAATGPAVAGKEVPRAGARPFRILGLQQVAIGGEDKLRLRHLWVDLLGLAPKGSFRSERENVDEDICALGNGASAVEIDLMQPIDIARKPAVHTPALNHIGLWVDDLPAAVAWLSQRGVRMAPGGIRKGAAGHDVCFIHPRPGDGFEFSGEGVLIELVQAPATLFDHV